MKQKHNITFLIALIAVLALAGGLWLHSQTLLQVPPPVTPPPVSTPTSSEDGTPTSTTACLKDGQIAKVVNHEAAVDRGDGTTAIVVESARIVIWNSTDERQDISSFTIPSDTRTSEHSTDYEIELRNCGAYMVRVTPSGDKEMWRYSYDGKGEKLFTLMGEGAPGQPRNYRPWFSIDDLERYVVLTSGYEETLLTIKDLETGRDLFEKQLEGTEFGTGFSKWQGDEFHFVTYKSRRPDRACRGDVDTKTWTANWVCSE